MPPERALGEFLLPNAGKCSKTIWAIWAIWATARPTTDTNSSGLQSARGPDGRPFHLVRLWAIWARIMKWPRWHLGQWPASGPGFSNKNHTASTVAQMAQMNSLCKGLCLIRVPVMASDGVISIYWGV